jgi:thermostable 8-oxoguanine DNA glycosylase
MINFSSNNNFITIEKLLEELSASIAVAISFLDLMLCSFKKDIIFSAISSCSTVII